MRVVSLSVIALGLAACGGEKDAAPIAPAPESAPADVSGPAAPETPAPDAAAGVAQTLQLVCGAPFAPDATAGTLMAAFGPENVIPETIDGPEGEKLNITAIYPGDPTRRIEVTFRDEEARTGVASVTVKGAGSSWTGPGGIRAGDTIAAIEKANGTPLQIAGFGWDYGGYVTDWSGGKLAQPAPKCRLSVRFDLPGDASSDQLLGDGVQLRSSQALLRSAKPTVVEFGISWE